MISVFILDHAAQRGSSVIAVDQTNLIDARPGIARALASVLGYTNPLRELDLIRSATTGRAKPAIVGRISLQNIDEVVEHAPEIVLVGRAIVGTIAPAHAAADLKEHFPR